jgi:hypothetical protein
MINLNSNYCRIGNSWMVKKKRFEFSRRNLIAFDFDKLFLAVDDVEFVFLVDVGDISCLEPSIRCKCLGCSIGSAPVTPLVAKSESKV